MKKGHLGKQFQFQILSAFLFALQEDITAFAIESKDYADSKFERTDGDIIIAEAKCITFKNHWTPTSLFYHYKEKGPLVQLWERWSGKESLAIFSSIPLREDIDDHGKITIDEKQIKEIVNTAKKRIPNLERKSKFTSNNVMNFLNFVRFIEYDFNQLDLLIAEWAELYGTTTNRDKLSRFVYFINSSYNKGEWISRKSFLEVLKLSKQNHVSTEIKHKRFFEEADRFPDVYFALLEPKTIELCAEFVFGPNRSPTDKHLTIQLVEDLLKENYVNMIVQNEQKYYKSSPNLIFDYFKTNILSRMYRSSRKDYQIPTSTERIVFEQIFNSNWFIELIRNHIGTDSTQHRFYYWRSSDGKLNTEDGFLISIAELFESVCQISFSISKWKEMKGLVPTYNEYNGSIKFDKFSEIWIKKKLASPETTSFIQNLFQRGLKTMIPYPVIIHMFDKLSHNLGMYCLPIEFTSMMRKGHRLQETYATMFDPN